jgi:hypothetical protein
MKHVVDMASGDVKHIPGFRNIGTDIEAVFRFCLSTNGRKLLWNLTRICIKLRSSGKNSSTFPLLQLGNLA